MVEVEFLELGKGVVKRNERRVVGLFIDGTGLDRATRRINKKVEIGKLVKGVTSGSLPVVARYYTLIPYEDDSRQRAFLDAIYNVGLDVVVKRLPPKGVTRQVSVDVEMAADIVAFAMGWQSFSDNSVYKGEEGNFAPQVGVTSFERIRMVNSPSAKVTSEPQTPRQSSDIKEKGSGIKEKRIVTIVCPSRDLSYPVSLVKEFGVDTIIADFGQFNSDLLRAAAKWIDLSDSETIWRD